jgi:cytochrome P450
VAATDIRASLPPGPTGPRAITVARFMLTPSRFLEDSWHRYGDLFTIELSAGRIVVACADPAVAKEVFTGDPALLHAGAGNVVLKPLLGPRSVLLLDGPEHLRQRRLMLPPFHGERMRAYGDVMREVAERHVAQWPVGEPFAVHASMRAITLEVILRAVFGVQEPAKVARLAAPLRQLLDSTGQARRLVALQFTRSEGARPRSPWGRVKAMLAPADRMLLDEIRTRRAELEAAGGGPGDADAAAAAAADRGDILSLLLAARDEDGRPLTDAELRDELFTLLVAGHETTATALAWTLERIVRHPEVLARLQDEAGRAGVPGGTADGAGRNGGGAATNGDTASRAGGDYLDAVMKETLRLRPVVPAVIRQLQAPMTFGGWDLPAGVHIAPNIYLIHRRPDLYPEPDAFRPERFLDRAPGTYEWLPFGGGIRRCLGASFALYELRTVLETILASTRLVPSTDEPERIVRRFVTLTPSQGGRITVAERRAASTAATPPPIAA